MKSCIIECEYIFNGQYKNNINPNEPEISVINFNIRSIKANFSNFTDFLSICDTKFDVITLTESWMDGESCPEDYTITGYHPPVIQNREDRSGGGVLMYFKECFESYNICKKLCYDDTYNNILTIRATKNKKPYCISVCYRSPSSENTTFLQEIEKVVSGIRSRNSIITGDFNYNLFNIKSHEETSVFYNIMTSKSFRTIITKPTRITDSSQTLIDHIWINDMSDNKIDAKIVICDITDHLPIFYVKYGAEKRQGYSKITYRPLTENNIAKFKDKIHTLDAALASHTTNPDHGAEDRAANYFNHLGRIYNDCFPVKTKKNT